MNEEIKNLYPNQELNFKVRQADIKGTFISFNEENCVLKIKVISDSSNTAKKNEIITLHEDHLIEIIKSEKPVDFNWLGEVSGQMNLVITTNQLSDPNGKDGNKLAENLKCLGAMDIINMIFERYGKN